MEVWAAAAVGIYSARKASKSAKAQSEFEAATNKEMVPLQGFEQRRTIQFESDLNERNLQKERSRKAKTFAGLARQQGLVGDDYRFQEVEVPDAPFNPVPNDEIYTRTAGLSNQPAAPGIPTNNPVSSRGF
jgi:hypothetical protein